MDLEIIIQCFFSIAHKSKRLQIYERFCLTSSLIPDCDCNSTSSAGIYFRPIICLQFEQFCLVYCKNARSLKTLSDYQNIMGAWHVVVMMDIEISCKGQFEKLSHFLDLVSHIVLGDPLPKLFKQFRYVEQNGRQGY